MNFTRHIFNVFDFYQLHILGTSEVRLNTGTSKLGLNLCAAIFRLPVLEDSRFLTSIHKGLDCEQKFPVQFLQVTVE